MITDRARESRRAQVRAFKACAWERVHMQDMHTHARGILQAETEQAIARGGYSPSRQAAGSRQPKAGPGDSCRECSAGGSFLGRGANMEV